ncbi:MAG: PmoA family protein [Phycisphaerae bacterium]|nr:PmoA family protein [Phycisphaerae bacterium]
MFHRPRLIPALFALVATALAPWCPEAAARKPVPAVAPQDLKLTPTEDGVRVEIGGMLFTQYLTGGGELRKPVLYPIIGPTGARMTRRYPIEAAGPGEKKDHPHHASLWYTHGRINGKDFWHQGKERQVPDGPPVVSGQTITARNKWVDGDGKIHLTDTRQISFGVLTGGSRHIDYDITLHASHGPVQIGDTKEGTMGIRTHPGLRIDKGAKAVNSAGIEGNAVWGKAAAWVDYCGKIDGRTVGVAIFDHASNPRHPTTWHARQYGLVAANPFGLKHFNRKAEKSGDMTIAAGQSVTFRYRFVFHEGDVKQAGVAELYAKWSVTEVGKRVN